MPAPRKVTLPKQEYVEMTQDLADLEFLKDTGLIFDAILFYLSQSHLTDHERNELREAMTILARGGAN